MTTASGEVPFAIDGQTLSSVEKASETVGGPVSVETILLVAGLAVVAVGVLGVLSYLYAARDEVDREIEEVEAERNAFLAFAERIEGIPIEQSAGAVATAPQSIQTLDSGGPPVAEVADAFEETVMALPHYADTYGNDVRSQMAIELDADLVAGLHHPGSMSEPAKEGLHQQAMEAASKREDLLDVLREEREALGESQTRVEDAVSDLRALNAKSLSEMTYDELAASHAELNHVGERLRSIADDRQRRIHGHIRTMTWNREEVSLQEYLYGEEGTTYPVLSTVARLDRLIERAQSRVRRALSSRV